MTNLILHNSGFRIELGAAENAPQGLSFDKLIIRDPSTDDSATLEFQKAIVFDQADFEIIFDANRQLRSFRDIANDQRTRDKVMARLGRLREELARSKLNTTSDQFNFFGIAQGLVASKAGFSLDLPILSPAGGALVRFEAWTALGVNLNIKVDKPAINRSEQAEIAINVLLEINAGTLTALTAALRPVFAELEQFLPDIPNIPFSGLSFEGMSLPDFPVVQLPMPDFLKSLGGSLDVDVTQTVGTSSLTVTDQGALEITYEVSNVTIAAKWDGSTFLKVTVENLSLSLMDGNFSVEYTAIEITPQDVAIDESFRFGGGAFPLVIRADLGGVRDIEATITATDFSITAKWVFKRLHVEVTGDAQTRLAVSLDLVTKSENGEFSTAVKNVKLLDFGGDIDLPEVTLPDLPFGLVSIPFAVPDFSGLEEVLDRLAKILSALMEYFSKAAGALVDFLSDVVKSAYELLSELIGELVDWIKGATEGLLFEVRLDAKNFRPVQLIVTAAQPTSPPPKLLTAEFGVFKASLKDELQPAFAYDFRTNWAGLILLNETETSIDAITLETDLWFAPETGPANSVGTVAGDAPDPLIKVTAGLKGTRPELVLVSFQDGEVTFFRKLEGGSQSSVTFVNDAGTTVSIRLVSDLSKLTDLIWEDDVAIDLVADRLKDKALALLPSGPTSSSGGLFEELSQRITVTQAPAPGGALISNGTATVKLDVAIEVGTKPDQLSIETTLDLTFDLRSFRAGIKGDKVVIKGGDDPQEVDAFGLRLKITPKSGGNMFILSFTDGNPRLDLADGATMEVVYDRLSTTGRGLVMRADRFGIGHGGLDLVANTVPDETVRLAGVDQAFRFTSGSIRIEGGELIGGAVGGSGPLPPDLIGEATADVSVTFGAQNGRFKVVAANGELSKKGEPLYSTGTRFKVTLDKIGFDYRDVASGGEHFFFLLWGEAAFEPAQGEFSSGLMKNLRSVAIKLDAAPLTGDASELLKHITFLVELDPPFRENLFDIFGFELRGIAFHPRSDAWPDTPPAIGLNGQVFVSGSNDIVQAAVDCHELLITYPSNESPLPRLRADGLNVMLAIGGLARVEATALAVDETIPSLYAPVALPADVTANGFLASGRVDITGLGAYGGAMGFLELQNKVISKKKHAMFIYAQAEKLAERVDTPIGPIWIREVGLGLGLNYTLTAIAAADQAKSPRELVRSLDEVSKYQGNLTTFKAWTPQFDKDALTLALRGMLSLTSASQNSSAYNTKKEKVIANPLLMDIVLALRTDLTFFANIRAWLAVNYHDWFSSLATESWKEEPTFRGYLYFSVPRKEFLARFIADGKGHIGDHPELDKNFKKALQNTRYSATLYIRPGLYHMELGWPYELGFDLGQRSDDFWLSVSGGTIFRIEDATALLGVAFRASGAMFFQGRVGGSSLGAAVVARASFAIGAKFIAFLAPFEPRETFFYGDVFVSITVDFSVSFWLEIGFSRFKKRFGINFTIYLTVSVAAEVVLGVGGVGARVQAAIGVRAFGRTLTVGLGFSFGDSALDRARARVARFMTLGLGVDLPQGDVLHTPAPVPEPARLPRAVEADMQLNQPSPAPLPDPGNDPEPVTSKVMGAPIKKTEFWAMLVLLEKRERPADNIYIMQLLPKDHSDRSIPENSEDETPPPPSTFFAEPFELGKSDGAVVPDFDFEVHKEMGDYKLTSTATTPSFPKHFLNDKGWEQTEIKDPAGQPFVRMRSSLEREVEEDLTLNVILADCFLAGEDKDEVFTFTEPMPIYFEQPTATGNQTSAAAVRRQASRLNVTRAEDEPGKEAEETLKRLASISVNERRSALIGKLGETLRDLGANARTVGVDRADWGAAESGFDARHFGLTFKVTGQEVTNWFGTSDEPKENPDLKIAKRLGKDGWSDPAEINLLRFPDQSFTEREPVLKDRKVQQTAKGLDLIWDLEPEFEVAVGNEFIEDPETFLDYYRIERSFEGLDVDWSESFLSRTTTCLEFKYSKTDIKVARERAKIHLNDDLTGGGVSEDFRALILGTPIPSGRAPWHVWNDVALGRDTISIVYKIVAVDEMGTETTPRVIDDFALHRPAHVVKPPLSAGITVGFEGGLPSAKGDDAPKLSLEWVFADQRDVRIEAGKLTQLIEPQPRSEYRLRIRLSRILGGGEYGSDAVDDARAAPSSQAIDQAREDDRDFLLKPVPPSDDALKIKFRSGDDDALFEETGYYTLTEISADLTELTTGADAHEALLAALGMVGEIDGHGRRVFVQRRVPQGEARSAVSSSWIIAQTQLQIWPAPSDADDAARDTAPSYNTIVEMLERPADMNFLAIDRQHMSRNAGRMELLMPKPGASLDEMLNAEGTSDSTTPIVRRVDPELRSAVELEINVHGIEPPSEIGNEADRLDPASGLGPVGTWAAYTGGFDVFTFDPARLRLTADRPGFDASEGALRRAATSLANRKATVKVLPRTLAGAFPAQVPDFRTLAPHYPSLARRTDPSARGNRREAPWYSRAESLVAFPMARLRRWLIPAPSEATISLLLDRFNAQKLRIEIKSPVVTNTTPPIYKFGIHEVGFSIDTRALSDIEVKAQQFSVRGAHILTLSRKEGKLLEAKDVRGALRSLRFGRPSYATSDASKWADLAAADQAYAAWRRSVGADRVDTVEDALEWLELDITLTTFSAPHPLAEEQPAPQRQDRLSVSLHSDIHPVLEDALAILPYEQLETPENTGISEDPHPGAVYRAYEPVREPKPPLDIALGTQAPKDTTSLEAFFDAFGPSSDPIGWGALRALGLAEGLRVYDIEKEVYLAGEPLLSKVNKAFKAALDVYSPVEDKTLPGEDKALKVRNLSAGLVDPRNLGSPFVELVGSTDAFASVGSYDGSDPADAKDWQAIKDSSEHNIVQISLRPRPAQQTIWDDGADEAQPYPVRYLLLRRSTNNFETDVKHSPKTIKFPPLWAFVADVAWQAGVTNNTRSTRVMNEELAKLVLDGTAQSDAPANTLDLTEDMLKRMAVMRPGETVGCIRVASIGKMTDTGEVHKPAEVTQWKAAFNALKEHLGDYIDFDIEGTQSWVAHPRFFDAPDHTLQGVHQPFDKFDDLAPDVLSMMQFGQSGPDPATRLEPLNNLLSLMPPGFAPVLPVWEFANPDLPVSDSFTGENAEAEYQAALQEADARRAGRRAKIEAANALATRIANWGARFLRHGTGRGVGLEGGIGQEGASQRHIELALIGMTTEDAMARVPNANGIVRMFFIEQSRNGREVLYAVRPFGRYASIAAQLSDTTRVPALTETSLGPEDADWKRKFLHVSLPRTRELDKPAILSAVQLDKDDPSHAGEIELVVARTPDQMIALGNTPAERALQPAWTGVELRADFPAKARAVALSTDQDTFQWQEHAVPPSDTSGVSQTALTGEIMTPDDLLQMRRRVPDAWRGSIRYGFRGLPHFLRISALAHQSAGVVVSDPAGVVLPEAGSVLRLPPTGAGPFGASDPRPAWGTTDGAKWTLLRDTQETREGDTWWIKSISEDLFVLFDLPMIRNLDMMPDQDLNALTNGDMRRVPYTYRLPDAKTSYQIALISNDRTVLRPQIEILPAVPKEPDPQTLDAQDTTTTKDPLYAAALSGRHFEAIETIENPLSEDECQNLNSLGDPKSTRHWRLTAKARPAPQQIVETEYEPLENLTDLVRDFEPHSTWTDGLGPKDWAVWAPRRKVTVSHDLYVIGTDPDPTKEAAQAAYDELQTYAGDYGVDSLRVYLQEIVELDPSELSPTSPHVFNKTVTRPYDLPVGLTNPTSGGTLVFTDSDTYLPRYHWAPQSRRFDYAERLRQGSLLGDILPDLGQRRIASSLMTDFGNFFYDQSAMLTIRQRLIHAPTSLEPQVLNPPFVFFDLRKFSPDERWRGRPWSRLFRQLINPFITSDAAKSDRHLSWQIERVWRRARQHPNYPLQRYDQVDLPVPFDLQVDPGDHREWHEITDGAPRRCLGMHRMPSTEELQTLHSMYPDAAEEILKLIETRLLGSGGARVTAFRGTAPPVTQRIKPSVKGGLT
ncbi:hypothetical protein [uncultured Tateyamaria sp.]|uniref:hypothetical protein n=1 Tax=uncultured Tateyamaria sp. TaxID=455651 RepID=UPI00261F47BA|nr:hypothetical protein [uncultured Tateyamaria sp.]